MTLLIDTLTIGTVGSLASPKWMCKHGPVTVQNTQLLAEGMCITVGYLQLELSCSPGNAVPKAFKFLISQPVTSAGANDNSCLCKRSQTAVIKWCDLHLPSSVLEEVLHLLFSTSEY